MHYNTKLIYIFWTCSTKEEAKAIIYGLLDQRLIACGSILPQVTSIYRWENKTEESQETKVILKTAERQFEQVQYYIQRHCSYKVPEIVQVDIVNGNIDYLDWVIQETTFQK